MARKREIGRGFYTDEDLAERSVWARLLFPALWQIADRKGRIEDRPAWIRTQAFPYEDMDAEEVNELLNELAKPKRHSPRAPEPFIVRYEVDGRRYIQIVNFERHQHIHPNEPPSQIPAPPRVIKDSRSPLGVAPEPTPSAQAMSSVPSMPSITTTDSGSASPAAPETPSLVDITTTPGTVTAEKSVSLAKVHVLAEAPWNREAAELWWAEYDGAPPKEFFAQLKPLVKREGWERVRPALVSYLAETPVQFVNLPKAFIGAFGQWVSKATGTAPARASPRGSVGERTLAAAERFIKRGGEGDRPERVLVGAEQIGDGRPAGDR
jgi:hypothetical protein